jgi:hypothetical protein
MLFASQSLSNAMIEILVFFSRILPFLWLCFPRSALFTTLERKIHSDRRAPLPSLPAHTQERVKARCCQPACLKGAKVGR